MKEEFPICEICRGKGETLARTTKGRVRMSCSHCNGERCISPDLLERKRLGEELCNLRTKFKILTREAAAGFGVGIGDWSNFEWGRGNLIDIQTAHEFLHHYTKDWRIETKYLVLAFTGGTDFQALHSATLAGFDGPEEAKTCLAQFAGKLYDGRMAVYQIQPQTTIIKPEPQTV